jgi:hypothetical protein
MKQKTLGEALSPLLQELSDVILENDSVQPLYDKRTFLSCLLIFNSALMDGMYSLQDKENMSMEDRIKMVTACGEELHLFIKKYTDIDTLKIV